MSDAQFFGYDYRGKQPSLVLRHSLRLADVPGVEPIDDWLRNYLGVADEYLADINTRRPKTAEQLARAVCERALILYGEFVRLCGLPSFDPGTVLAVDIGRDDRATADLVVRLPLVDHFPQKFFSGLYGDVIAMTYRFLAYTPSESAIAELYGKIEQLFIGTLRKSVPFVPATVPICKLAYRADIPFRHMGGGVIQFGWGAKSRIFHNAAFQQDSAVGANIAHNKQLTARVLRAAGFPVPDHLAVTNPQAAVEAAAKLGWPVVVKPADCERSIGVTIDISSEDALLEAYSKAAAASSQVLVERHIPGTCHRIMVADGKIVYAVKRDPKAVVGNGTDTVRALVASTNAGFARMPPWRRLQAAVLDDLALSCLARAGLDTESVPEPGQVVPLRPYVSDEWGGSIDDVRDRMHPDNARLAIDIARALRLSFAGVDFITTDISVPWHQGDGAINEVNFQPQYATVERRLAPEGILSLFSVGDGRVPVHIITGSENLLLSGCKLAENRRREGLVCYVTDAGYSEDGQGRPMNLTAGSLFDRVIALLMRDDLDELVVVDERQDLLKTGFPVDRIASLSIYHSDKKARDAIKRQFELRAAVKSVSAVKT